MEMTEWLELDCVHRRIVFMTAKYQLLYLRIPFPVKIITKLYSRKTYLIRIEQCGTAQLGFFYKNTGTFLHEGFFFMQKTPYRN